MKRSFTIGLMILSVIMTVSCSKTKSYSDWLKEEEKAIDRLFDERGFVVLKDFPRDGVFKDNEFVKLESDIYINIIDKGDEDRMAEKYKTEVLSRYTANYIRKDTTIYIAVWSNYGPNSNGTLPIQFKYGFPMATPQSTTSVTQSVLEAMVSEGMQVGLEYVGEGGKVKLIVPFKRGSTVDQGNYDPVFFEILEYKYLD